MKVKFFLISMVYSLSFGLISCGGDSSDTVIPPNNSGFGNDIPNSSASVIDPNAGNQNVPITPTGGIVAPLASVANAQFPAELYAAWKSYHYTTLDQEALYYPSISSDFSYVFSPAYLPAARVVWSTQTSGMYAIHCKVNDTTAPQMKSRGCTVSEGIGYGMLITSFQNDVLAYNSLWNYSRAFRAYHTTGLTPWITFSFSFQDIDVSSATDADLDIATSLVLMYFKTNVQDYLNDALVIINAIWDKEVNPSNFLLYSGDTDMWTTRNPIVYNLSYFAPVALRLFAMVDPNHQWNKVLDAMYAYMIRIQDSGTGVFPDWSTETDAENPPNDAAGNEKTGFTYHTFNKESVRIPWRIAWDYYWFQDERAKQILSKLNAFIVQKSGGDPSSIALSVNYSWDPNKPDYTKNTAVPKHWLGAWCVTGIGTNPTWLETCTSLVNASMISNNGNSYFPDILLMMYSQLLNHAYVKPF